MRAAGRRRLPGPRKAPLAFMERMPIFQLDQSLRNMTTTDRSMNDYNESLFDDADFLPPTPPPRPSMELVIRGGKDAPLSNKQRTFNRLAKRIASLQKGIEKERERLETLFLEWSATIPPLRRSLLETQIQLLHFLDSASKRFRFGPRQHENLASVICGLCSFVFEEDDDNEDVRAVYERWTGKTLLDEEIAEFDFFKSMFRERLHEELDIDVDEFESSFEGFAHFQHTVREKVLNGSFNGSGSAKKNKKETAAEAKRRQEQEKQKRGLRSVYLSLAKMLHPDKTTDKETRTQREEVMKSVTAAYKNRDMETLLRIEMAELSNDTNELEEVDDDVLDLYIAALKNQVAELEVQRYDLSMHPRYRDISDYAYYRNADAIRMIREDASAFMHHSNMLQSLLATRCGDRCRKEDVMVIVNTLVREVSYLP
jgi:hypothetical protein